MDAHRARHQRALWLMLLSAASFTATTLFVRTLSELHAANIWLVSSARFIVGLLICSTLYRRDFQPGNLIRHPKLIERGLVGGLGTYITYLAVVKIGAGRATFISNSYVVWAALLAAWILKERLRPGVVVGGVAALVGIGLLTNIVTSGTPPGVYDLLAVASALMSAFVIVAIRQLHGTEHTSTIFAAQCAYGLLICLVPAVVTFQPIPTLAWVVIGGASLAAGVGQLTMTQAFRDLGAAEGSLMQMIVPLGVAIGGAAFFGEHFARHEVVGAALILAGTAFTVATR